MKFLRKILLKFRKIPFFKKYLACDSEDIDAQRRQLMPAVLAEQTSAVMLDFINTLVMSTVSSAAIAGVGQVGVVSNLVSNFFYAFAMGGTVMAAQYIGARNPRDASRTAAQSLVAGTLLSFLVATLLVLARTPILNLLFGSVAPDVMAYSVKFFSLSIFSTPFWFIFYQCSGVMRAAGDARSPMRISIIMNIVSFALNILFVIILGLGALGCGLALLFSVALGAGLCLFAICKPSHPVCLRPYITLKLKLSLLMPVIKVGFPASLESITFNIGRVVMQVIVSTMGTSAVAAFQVANMALGIWQLPLNTLSVLSVTLVGRAAGTGDRDKTKYTLSYLCRYANVYALYCSIAVFFLAYPICLVLTRDPQVLQMSILMSLMFAGFAWTWSGAWTTPNGFKGARYINFGFGVGACTMWICRVFGTYLFGVVLGWGAYGAFFSMFLDWFVRTLIFTPYRKSGRWLKNVTLLKPIDE